jgi:O-antigen biosynthesis protein WbqP
MIIRLFDLSLALVVFLITFIPCLLIALLIKLTSKGSVLHWSKRIGKGNKLFLMPKFRTMKVDTPQIATHLMLNEKDYLTSIGSFLRKSSLDELPQLLVILNGEMSFVGPRPALFNQEDLIELRTIENIHLLRPGITGWAQVNGRDELSIIEKVSFDKEYLHRISLLFNIRIIYLTAIQVLARKGIKH